MNQSESDVIGDHSDGDKLEKTSKNTDIDDLTKVETENLLENEDLTELEKNEKEEEPEKKPENPLDDFIDEELLKENELALTEEEKQIRREESEKLKQQGNDEFKNGLYKESIDTYTSALRLCPLVNEQYRAILYANRAASKIKLDYKESALDDCTRAISLYPTYVKALFRRAKLYESMDKLDESLEDYKKLQVLEPTNSEINYTIRDLNIRIEKRNEEMKTEMLGKVLKC